MAEGVFYYEALYVIPAILTSLCEDATLAKDLLEKTISALQSQKAVSAYL